MNTNISSTFCYLRMILVLCLLIACSALYTCCAEHSRRSHSWQVIILMNVHDRLCNKNNCSKIKMSRHTCVEPDRMVFNQKNKLCWLIHHDMFCHRVTTGRVQTNSECTATSEILWPLTKQGTVTELNLKTSRSEASFFSSSFILNCVSSLLVKLNEMVESQDAQDMAWNKGVTLNWALGWRLTFPPVKEAWGHTLVWTVPYTAEVKIIYPSNPLEWWNILLKFFPMFAAFIKFDMIKH